MLCKDKIIIKFYKNKSSNIAVDKEMDDKFAKKISRGSTPILLQK